MIKRTVFSIGLAIMIGVASGYFFSEEKFYYSRPNSPKNEITQEYYYDNNNVKSEYLSREVVFNLEKSLAIGFAALGLFFVISSVFKPKKSV